MLTNRNKSLYTPSMRSDLATASRRAEALGHHQRLLAAERLAAGDPLVLVAAAVHADEDALRVLDTDDSFRRLVDACRGIQEMPREDWRGRAERLLRGAAERAIADGRVSTVNLILRATRALDEPQGDGCWSGMTRRATPNRPATARSPTSRPSCSTA
jgi:hypothetical protein